MRAEGLEERQHDYILQLLTAAIIHILITTIVQTTKLVIWYKC